MGGMRRAKADAWSPRRKRLFTPMDEDKLGRGEPVRRTHGARHRNPKINEDANGKEISYVKRRREELASLGLSDISISKLLAGESRAGKESGILKIIWKLIRRGELSENNNRRGTGVEIEWAIKERRQLILGGLNDRRIAEKLAVTLDVKTESVVFLIWKIVHIGRCGENPNNKE